MKPADPIVRTPMDLDQARVSQGTVHVIDERCKECSFCIQYCPADVLEYSKTTNSKGYHFPVIVEGKESACVLCKFCDLICPDLAIYTTAVDEIGEGS